MTTKLFHVAANIKTVHPERSGRDTPIVIWEKFKTFNIFGYTKDEVRSGEEFLKQPYKNHSKLISGIGKYHYIKIVNDAVIMQYVPPSCVCHSRNKVVEEQALLQIDDIAEERASPIMDLDMDNNELEEGMYVVVTYQEVNFPGIIMATSWWCKS